jgi:hypothetical protein
MTTEYRRATHARNRGSYRITRSQNQMLIAAMPSPIPHRATSIMCETRRRM